MPLAINGVVSPAANGFWCWSELSPLSNQASFWHALRLAGVKAHIEGFGALFDFS
jgi:hypothetical protein